MNKDQLNNENEIIVTTIVTTTTGMHACVYASPKWLPRVISQCALCLVFSRCVLFPARPLSQPAARSHEACKKRGMVLGVFGMGFVAVVELSFRWLGTKAQRMEMDG